VGSFKVRLAAYFALLALVPFVAAFQGFHSVAKRSETRRVDAVLESSLRSALVAYGEQLARSHRRATTLAGRRRLQRALATHDEKEVRAFLGSARNVYVESADGRLHAGRMPTRGVVTTVSIVGPSRPLGEVTTALPFDTEVAGLISRRAGLEPRQRVAFVVDGVIGEGAGLRGVRLDARPEHPTTLSLAGTKYRAIASRTLSSTPPTALVVLAPQSAIDRVAASIGERLVLTMLAVLILLILIAYYEGRAIVRTLGRLVDAANDLAQGRLDRRVDVGGPDEFARLGRAFNDMADQLEERIRELDDERRRLRDVTMRFGEALAATHDVDELLRVVVESAVEATGARGGALLREGHEVVRAGDPDHGARRLEFHLAAGEASFGRLVLSGDEFTKQQTETADWLVRQAQTGLANARQHRIVQQQALVDSLTGLPNRRLCEAALEKEIGRADRFGEPLSIVVGDIDDFKHVNDRYGHATGDEVLREFARALRETVREIDLAARWGGEEFVVGLPGTDLDGGVRLAERVREELGKRSVTAPAGQKVRVTASFGAAQFDGRGGLPELLAAADSALYRAKRAGKDRVSTLRQPEVPSVGAARLGA
jgi:diguanylate cyclase (GGDEF)-like protein